MAIAACQNSRSGRLIIRDPDKTGETMTDLNGIDSAEKQPGIRLSEGKLGLFRRAAKEGRK